jgi:hypothetical protein
MKARVLVVAAFVALVVGLGITAYVQTRSHGGDVSVSAEMTCRVVTRRTFDSLARGRVTQSKAQATVDQACDAVPALARKAIIDGERAAAFARYLTPSK